MSEFDLKNYKVRTDLIVETINNKDYIKYHILLDTDILRD